MNLEHVIRREKARSERLSRNHTCQQCGNPIDPLRPYGPNMTERDELYRQTPVKVWRDYAESGYTLAQAISMEFSYL